MRWLVLALALAGIAGCSEVKPEDQTVQKDIVHYQHEQEEISADAKKIKVVFTSKVKGYPQYTELGRTEGYCFNIPNATGGQVVHGDSLKMAAYRKYGDQVNAIINTRVWFVPDESFGIYEPYDEEGYLWCAGTAVHFSDGWAPPKPS